MAHSPLLCDPAHKPQREATNAVEQLKYIEYLVNTLDVRDIRLSHIEDFHRYAVADIYPCAGHFRGAGQSIRITGSTHMPPEPALVKNYVLELVDELNDSRDHLLAIDRAAYALWRLNWIHPFMGGNGRTARALSYLVLCIDLGGVPPGRPQMPVTIAARREEYDEALRAGDCGNLGPMTTLVEEAITRQLDNASDRPSDRT